MRSGVWVTLALSFLVAMPATSQNSPGPQPQGPQPQAEVGAQLETVVVTGSRIPRLTALDAGPAPVVESEGFVAYRTNPHHRRAKLVVLTERGTRVFQSAAKRQSPWINALVEGISLRDIRCALKVARALDEKLNA
jgi:hypothetical protein